MGTTNCRWEPHCRWHETLHAAFDKYQFLPPLEAADIQEGDYQAYNVTEGYLVGWTLCFVFWKDMSVWVWDDAGGNFVRQPTCGITDREELLRYAEVLTRLQPNITS